MISSIIVASLLWSVRCGFSKQLGREMYIYTKVTACNSDQIRDWNCGYFCDQHPDMEQVKVFESPQYSTLAYSGLNQAENRLVVSFRSTQNIQNFISDLKFLKMDYPCDGCRVHTGFMESYVDMKSELLEYVGVLAKQNPKTKLTVVGHSLGGAMATLAAIDLHLAGLKVETFYIFGSPRVGNSAFGKYFNSIVVTKNKARVTHYEDLVPHLPPISLDYEHAVQEYWFTQDFKSYRECNGFEDSTCSNSVWSRSIADHQSYFNIRYRCNDDHYLYLTQNEIIL